VILDDYWSGSASCLEGNYFCFTGYRRYAAFMAKQPATKDR